MGTAVTAQSVGNVFPIAGARAATHDSHHRVVKPESVGLLNDCRDMALERIVELLARTFDKIEDELIHMAEKAADRDAQNMYLEARVQSREKRSAIESSFKKQFLGFFEKKVAGEDEPGRVPRFDYSAMELSLVEDFDLEQKLALSDIAKRMSDTCDDELRTLSQRMGFLLSKPELKDDANPIAPDTIIQALKVACDQMTSGYQAKLMVMRLVEQHIAKDMQAIYHDINSHLIARKVLPQIRPTYRKATSSAPRNSTNTSPPVAGALNSRLIDANKSTDTSIPAGDVLATLQQLLAGVAVFDSAQSDIPAKPDITPGHLARSPAQQPSDANSIAATQDALRRIANGESATGNADLVSALTEIQHRLLRRTGSQAVSTVAGDFAPGETPFAALNTLREIKSQGVVESCSQIDVMTVDIVAMLFDYVFDDKAIPDAIKGLIARLQIPVLKVALMDRTFFSRKTHPVRHLLDALADASVCLAGETNCDDPLYMKIESLVDRVHTEFETDFKIFSDVLADFEKFIAEREIANAEFIEKSARVVHERERREMARLIAQDETERRVVNVGLPPPVAAMLNGPWTRVLERIYLREDGRHAGFVRALETLDNLIWSVQAKVNAHERKQLVSMLPGLLKNLQQGMEIAAVESDERSRFFSSLVDCHAAAVKAGLRGESVSSLLASVQSNADTVPLFAKLIEEEKTRAAAWKKTAQTGLARIQFTDRGVEIEELGPDSKHANKVSAQSTVIQKENRDFTADFYSNTSGTVDFDITDMPVVELKRGAWVEFLHNGNSRIRAKLSWISPLKGIYLFTNPGAIEALSIAPATLQDQFRQGVAKIIDGSSLIDRAVDKMVNSLSEAAHT